MRMRKKTLHEKIFERLKRRIMKLPDGTKLPSQEELCEEFGVSRTVLREAIVGLEKDGLILRRQGLGTFVVKESKLAHVGLEYLRGIFKIISSSGRTPSFLMNECEKVTAEERIAGRLKIEPGEDIVKASHIYAADGIPVIYAETYIASNRIYGGAERFLRIFSQSRSKVLFSIMEELKKPVKYAVAEVTAVTSDQNLSKLLKVETGKSLVLLSEVHFGVYEIPLMYSEDYVNTDLFTIQVVREKI